MLIPYLKAVVDIPCLKIIVNSLFISKNNILEINSLLLSLKRDSRHVREEKKINNYLYSIIIIIMQRKFGKITRILRYNSKAMGKKCYSPICISPHCRHYYMRDIIAAYFTDRLKGKEMTNMLWQTFIHYNIYKIIYIFTRATRHAEWKNEKLGSYI